MPSLGSCLLENMILDCYQQCTASQWLDFDERFVIDNRAKKDDDCAVEASNNETSDPNYANSAAYSGQLP